MVPLRAFRKTLFVLAVTLACGVGVCFLPENVYQRWQLLDGTLQGNARWIYERSHFDPAPIDVVFLGPSRTGIGVNAPLLARALEARGLPSNVVNFSLPDTGRNTNWAAAEELFADKKPKLVVLGVMEQPARYGHPAFKYLAAPQAIALPGYLADLNYFSDLVYLPFRQLRLFAANLFPGSFGLAKDFDPTRYRGHSIDTTGFFLPDGRVRQAELIRGAKEFEATIHPPRLPHSLADLEYGDERHYTRAIAELAKKNGAKVAFLFMPYYNGPSQLQDVQELRLYEQFGPVLNAGFLATHAEWYGDYAHLTHDGANVFTDWLVDPVAELLKGGKIPS